MRRGYSIYADYGSNDYGDAFCRYTIVSLEREHPYDLDMFTFRITAI